MYKTCLAKVVPLATSEIGLYVVCGHGKWGLSTPGRPNLDTQYVVLQ